MTDGTPAGQTSPRNPADRISLRERYLWLAPAIVAASLAIILLMGLLLFRTYWGDPAIYLPYARNIARGDFFSYNPGAFSSGSTSPLWALLLSIPFLLGVGPAGAKVFSLLATLLAYLLVLATARRMSGGKLAAALASLYLVEMMTLYGVLMYESSLVVALVALGIAAGERVARRAGGGEPLRFADLLPLILVWGALPVSRPDAVVLVVLQLAALWLGPLRRSMRGGVMLLSAALIAAVPSLFYFGYSQITLGTISVSSRCRAFALHEMAQRLGPLLYSKSALGYLGSILYAILLAAIGLDLFRQESRRGWFAWYGGAALLFYPLLLVFASPVTNDLSRYFLPIAPIIVVAVARTLRQWDGASPVRWKLAALTLGVLFLVKPAASVLGDGFDQSRRGYGFEEIMEREAMEKINAIAHRGDTVLAYEVQDRYYLRDDIGLLSLDGITDGKVAPYLESGDMGAFLRRYRPAYWVANNSVDYRPYLERSILSSVAESFRLDSTRRELRQDGITFRVIERRSRPMPKGFAGWTMILGLSYDTLQKQAPLSSLSHAVSGSNRTAAGK
jgi:hypothetical protein